MLNKALRVGIVLSAAALALTGCGGSTTPGASSAAPTTAATSAAPSTVASTPAPTAASPSVMSSTDPARDANADLVIWCDNDRSQAIANFAAAFGAEQGVKVAVQVATDVRAQFAAATKVGKGPDIIIGAHDWLGEFVQNNLVAPVPLSADVQAQFPKNVIAAATYNAQLYAVPVSVESLGLIRNTDLVPDAPKSMEDLIKTAKALQAAGKVTTLFAQQIGTGGNAYNTFPWLTPYGGGIFALDAKGGYDANQVIVDNAGSLAAGANLALMGKEKVLSTSIDANTDTLFDTKKSAFELSGPWAISGAQKAGIKYAISPLPTLNGSPMKPFLGVQEFYLSAKAKNATIAQQFLTDYITRKDTQVALYQVTKRPPALTAAYDEVAASDADVKAWGEAAKDCPPMPAIPAMNAVWGPLGQAGADIISGKATDPAARMKQAAKEIRDAIAKSK